MTLPFKCLAKSALTMSGPQASSLQPPPTPPLNPTKFTNRVTIITGAASGIGKETAIFFARQDAQVILFDINEAGLLETHHFITTSGLLEMCSVRTAPANAVVA